MDPVPVIGLGIFTSSSSNIDARVKNLICKKVIAFTLD